MNTEEQERKITLDHMIDEKFGEIFGGSWQGSANTFMDSNGSLEKGLTWLDVHNVVERTKQAMGI